jgi:mRNA interferase YafQ
VRTVRTTSRFRKSLKRILKSGLFKRKDIEDVVDILVRGEKLDNSYSDHQLSGDMIDNRECHIRSDLLLMYRIEDDNLVLVLINIGSHSELFD